MDSLPVPWSTQPITGAQHDAWMAEDRRNAGYPNWVHLLDLADDFEAKTRALITEWAMESPGVYSKPIT